MSTFEERRAARLRWPIRRTTLGEETLTDERLPDDVDARITMVATLTLSQWAMSGRQLPTYSRATMPGRIIRPPRDE